MRRLAIDDDAFDFLSEENISVRVLGPIPSNIIHEGSGVQALPLLIEPPRTLGEGIRKRTYSDSQTINGHSVVLSLTYGNVRFLFGGDLNRESMERLLAKVPKGGLEAEILKVPHHGSADFDEMALREVAPVVSLISSGDESTRTEYIHPRANLLAALGRVSRCSNSLVLCTELASFFAYRGLSICKETRQHFVGFERLTFGIVHVRTDGERVLIFTHSGKADLKEAYRFRVAKDHSVRFEDVKGH